MAFCWLCETAFTEENLSREHIIPAALGGRRTVAGFLCRRCNNTTGSEWDASLIDASKPMDFIASLRDWETAEPTQGHNLSNKSNRHETVSDNETRTMYRGGGDSVSSFDGRTLNIEIASHSQAQLLQILKGIRRKYSIPERRWADLVQAASSQLAQAFPKDRRIQTGMALNLAAASRAMVKSMLALACTAGVRPEECQQALAHCRADDQKSLGTFPKWEVFPPEVMSGLRCVAISGSSETGMLLGFAALTGSLPWMMPLAIPYDGPTRHAVYAIEAKTGKAVDVSPQMERPRAEAVAMETAGRLTEIVFAEEDLSPEEYAMLSDQGNFPNKSDRHSTQELLASKLRPLYCLSKDEFNQNYRIPLGLPPVEDDESPY